MHKLKRVLLLHDFDRQQIIPRPYAQLSRYTAQTMLGTKTNTAVAVYKIIDRISAIAPAINLESGPMLKSIVSSQLYLHHSMSIAITEAITTIAEAERRFGLSRTEDEAFFLEWQTRLPELSQAE